MILGLRLDAQDVEWSEQFVWHLGKNGYLCRNLKHGEKWTMAYLHREIAERAGSELTGQFVDHVNRDKLDNRRSNLRMVSPTQSTYNKGPQKRNRLGIRGVIFDTKRKKFRASVTFQGRTVWQKRFDCLPDAVEARRLKAVEYFGEFA